MEQPAPSIMAQCKSANSLVSRPAIVVSGDGHQVG